MAKRKAQGKKKRKKEGISAGRIFYGIIIAAIIVVAAHFSGEFTYDDWKGLFGLLSSRTAEGEVYVYYIDVGQGDSELIVSDGHAVLIDTGEKENGQRVCDKISEAGVKKLDYLILSHPHSDHMGAAAYVLDNVKTDNVIIPKLPDDMTPSTKIYEDFLSSVKRNGLKLTPAKQGLKIDVGEAELEIISPVSDDYGDLNDFSAAAVLRHGDNTFLFMGDCEKKAEKDIAESGGLAQADVLKMGHHGSSSSSSGDFLEIVRPNYAVISCGEGNSYGHPNAAAIERIKKYTDKIYRTDIDGTIVFTSSEDGISVETEK